MLHTVTTSPFQSQALADCLRYSSENDVILLLQDAVVAAIDENNWCQTLKNSGRKVYLLQEDARARGLIDKLTTDVEVIDYTGFVALTITHDTQMKWA
ncbi:sulfur relay protein TusB [Photobacterium jeanii]|uniref:Sulfur relay protein TusB n=1 Tax=Photobacterium jeanii TaxID=858640 RepID=A0A178KIM9_9GAMM|nr:sulfurtransferase complex subunit TusB [Photobacterium jeanii]OAN17091.1 sulfur relay protein TusB [Photobacterium jeanii]PST88380.1 sulfurtransferase complex subunit TusB [Photobacterium jeanii]